MDGVDGGFGTAGVASRVIPRSPTRSTNLAQCKAHERWTRHPREADKRSDDCSSTREVEARRPPRYERIAVAGLIRHAEPSGRTSGPRRNQLVPGSVAAVCLFDPGPVLIRARAFSDQVGSLPLRHGPAHPGHLSKHRVGTGSPDELGTSALQVSAYEDRPGITFEARIDPRR